MNVVLFFPLPTSLFKLVTRYPSHVTSPTPNAESAKDTSPGSRLGKLDNPENIQSPEGAEYLFVMYVVCSVVPFVYIVRVCLTIPLFRDRQGHREHRGKKNRVIKTVIRQEEDVTSHT
jgi:hypothetical protein